MTPGRLFVPLAVAVLSLYVAAALLATAQYGEVIVLDGRAYSLLTNPLKPFLAENPDAIPEPRMISTALWRGYVASWAVVDRHLILQKIEVLRAVEDVPESTEDILKYLEKGGPISEIRDVLDEVFSQSSDVVADWFTGYLVVPTGKQVKYVHMGYASLFSEYVVLEVRDGAVVGQKELRRKPFVKFMQSQFEAFKATDEYRTLLKTANGNEEFVFQIASEIFTSTIYEGNPWSEPIR